MYLPTETSFQSITLSVANKIQKEIRQQLHYQQQQQQQKTRLIYYFLIFMDHDHYPVINNNGQYSIVKTKNEL